MEKKLKSAEDQLNRLVEKYPIELWIIFETCCRVPGTNIKDWDSALDMLIQFVSYETDACQDYQDLADCLNKGRDVSYGIVEKLEAGIKEPDEAAFVKWLDDTPYVGFGNSLDHCIDWADSEKISEILVIGTACKMKQLIKKLIGGNHELRN